MKDEHIFAGYLIMTFLTFCYLLNETQNWRCPDDIRGWYYRDCGATEEFFASVGGGAIWPIFWGYRIIGKPFGRSIFYTEGKTE